MNKYNDSKIYKIVCLKTNQKYFGSTTKRLSNAISLYQSYYRSYLKGKYNYITVFEVLKNEHYKTILLEHYKCENKEQLNQRLKTYLDANPECVNRLGFLTKEKKQEYQKKYYKLHKEQFKQYNKEYYKVNREQILKKKNDKYQVIKDYQKQYYQDNKEKLNKKLSCFCGGHYTYQNFSIHFKTAKHKNYLKQNILYDNI